MKKAALVFLIVVLSLLTFPSFLTAQETKKSCFDLYLECAKNCVDICRECETTSTGYQMCGTNFKCSGECIAGCGNAQRDCEKAEEAVGQPLEVAPTPATESPSETSPSPEPTEQAESTYVEALIDNVPTKNDLKSVPLPQEAKKSPLTAVVMELDGIADMQLADGTWVVVKNGDLIPSDAKIMVGFDSNLTLQFSDYMVATLRSLTEFDMHRFAIDANHLQIKIDTDVGDIRFKVLEGRFQTDLEVSTPVSTGAVTGTDISVSYHKEKGSIWEVYDGRLEVTNKKTEEKKVITSSYNNSIKRIEISNDGTMTEKTAIPKSQWQNFLASSQKENKATSTEGLKTKGIQSFMILPVAFLAILAIVGGAIMYQKRYGPFSFKHIKEQIIQKFTSHFF